MTIPSPEKFFDVRITSRVEFADDLWMIRVDPGSQDFHFAPGQYATLGVDNGQGLIERAYSIVSSPYEREIEFFFELVPQGALTPLLYKLGPGDTVKARKVAKGRFTLDTVSGRTNHLLLATVTGVAPYVSYVRALRKDAADGKFAGEHKLFIIQGASHSRELGYGEELERLAAELPWLTYVPTISRPWDDPAWTGETGTRRRHHPEVHRSVGARHKHDVCVPLRPPRDDRARQVDPEASGVEERSDQRRGLLHPQARAGGVSFSGVFVTLEIGGRCFRNEFLTAILPLWNVNTSQPATSTRVPFRRVPVNVHSDRPRSPATKWRALPQCASGYCSNTAANAARTAACPSCLSPSTALPPEALKTQSVVIMDISASTS